MLCRELDSAALPPRSLGPEPLPSDFAGSFRGLAAALGAGLQQYRAFVETVVASGSIAATSPCGCGSSPAPGCGAAGQGVAGSDRRSVVECGLPVDSVRLDAPGAGLFGLAVALALAERLERAGVAVRIKWPNDLLVEGRKLAGILRLCCTGGMNCGCCAVVWA